MVEALSAVLLSVGAGLGAKIVANIIKHWIDDKAGHNITVKFPNGNEITLSKDHQSVEDLHKKVETLQSRNRASAD